MTPHNHRLSQGCLARELYSPREVEQILGISHATLYRLINAGRLDARKIDGKTVITVASLEAFIDALPAANLSPKEAA